MQENEDRRTKKGREVEKISKGDGRRWKGR